MSFGYFVNWDVFIIGNRFRKALPETSSSKNSDVFVSAARSIFSASPGFKSNSVVVASPDSKPAWGSFAGCLDFASNVETLTAAPPRLPVGNFVCGCAHFGLRRAERLTKRKKWRWKSERRSFAAAWGVGGRALAPRRQFRVGGGLERFNGMNGGARKRAGKLASRSRVFVERRRKRENARRRVVRKIFRPPESGCGTRRAKSNEQEQVERAVNAKLVRWGECAKAPRLLRKFGSRRSATKVLFFATRC